LRNYVTIIRVIRIGFPQKRVNGLNNLKNKL